MNERIEQLAEQAGIVFWEISGDVDWRQANRETLEKFAELIVRECAQVSEDDISDGDACCTNTADRIARQIKKHFGVEEPKGWVCPKCSTDRTKAACPQGPSAAVDGSCPMFGVAQ
jgi:hypothetical protein